MVAFYAGRKFLLPLLFPLVVLLLLLVLVSGLAVGGLLNASGPRSACSGFSCGKLVCACGPCWFLVFGFWWSCSRGDIDDLKGAGYICFAVATAFTAAGGSSAADVCCGEFCSSSAAALAR